MHDNAANSRIIGHGTKITWSQHKYMSYRYTLYFWWHMFSADCTTQQAAFQTYSAGQNISCECAAVRVWNVVEWSSTRCCVQDLLTTLHIHLMDETNSRAEISDCTNVCYTYHTQHQVSTPVIHVAVARRRYGEKTHTLTCAVIVLQRSRSS